MKLRDLLAYDDIVIQCHDNPDADALACGYAVYRYLTAEGKSPALIYSGNSCIRKGNLRMLVEDLGIPIEYTDRLKAPQLLVMVDCQYTGGNVTYFPAEHVAVIDHHRVCTKLPELSEVRSSLGACSTLLWQMLKEENYDVENDRKLATALYYGLYTDTNGFTEIVHPLDKDLRDEARFDPSLMMRYRNANLSLEELETAGAALLHSDYLDEYRAALVKAGPCEPNLLGIISDLVLEVDVVDICIVFNVREDGVKFSVRSCTKEVRASELAEELSKGIGSGGGHLLKAGGFIQMDLLTEVYLDFCAKRGYTPRMELAPSGKKERPSASGIKALLEQRLREYMDGTDIIYAENLKGRTGMEPYFRRPLPWGYVCASELFEPGSRVRWRAINGDGEFTIANDTILTFEPRGGLYRTSKEEFEKHYRVYPDWKFHLKEAEYRPTVQERNSGDVLSLVDYAAVCVPKGDQIVYARQLEGKVKLFGTGDQETYVPGRAGDYLLGGSDGMRDATIMDRKNFERIYVSTREAKEAQKAVVFDLDGTLLDTLMDLKEAVNAALVSQNLPPCTLEQVRQYVGNGIRRLMVLAVPGGEENPDFEKVFAFFKEYYGQHCLDHTAPYHNIIHLMRELKMRRIPVAIVSNKVDSAVRELADRFFAEYAAVAIGETENVARKPAPDMVNAALQQLGVAKENAIYVGDSEVDLETAANAGIPCVSVTWGFRDKTFLRRKGAKTLIERPLELLYLL